MILYLIMCFNRTNNQVSVLNLSNQPFAPNIRTATRVVYTITVNPYGEPGEEGRDWLDELTYWLRAVNVREQDAILIRALITRKVMDILQEQRLRG